MRAKGKYDEGDCPCCGREYEDHQTAWHKIDRFDAQKIAEDALKIRAQYINPDFLVTGERICAMCYRELWETVS